MLFADDFRLIEKAGQNLLINPGFETEESWKTVYSAPVSYDLYNDWCSWSKWSLDLLPQGKGLWYDEYNVHFEYNKRKTDPKHGTRIAMANVAMMNSGVQNTLLWTLFDQQWPNNHTTNADSFVDGNHQCGLMPVLTESLVPYPAYYAFSACQIYGRRAQGFAEDLSATRLHSTLSLLPDGNLSLLIVNTNDSEISFEYDFTKNMNITLYRHLYNPSVLERNEKAEPIPSDKTVAVPKIHFSTLFRRAALRYTQRLTTRANCSAVMQAVVFWIKGRSKKGSISLTISNSGDNERRQTKSFRHLWNNTFALAGKVKSVSLT